MNGSCVKSATESANNTSFQTFMNCYLREVDTGVWHSCLEWQLRTGLRFSGEETHVIELQLNKLNTTLALGVSYRSQVGKHRLTCIYQQQSDLKWQQLDSISVIMLLIKNIYGQTEICSANTTDQKTQQLELMARTVESHQVMAHYIKERSNDPLLHGTSFISSEQSILLGHWFHPTPKSRQGIHEWQHQHYTPELAGKFQLHYFSADRELVRQSSSVQLSAEQIIRKIISKDPEPNSNPNILDCLSKEIDKGNVFLPVHPLQAQWLVNQPHIKQLIKNNRLTDIGTLGPYFTPTSSVRTLYCEELDYMLKLSIPVKITNSLRVNMEHELDAGLVVAKLFEKCGFSKQRPQFQTINDPAYITLNLPEMEESGFEIIIRDNPFSKAQRENEALSVQSIAALTQEPIDPATPSRLAALVNQLSKKENKPLKEVSLQWFDAYWDCAIESAIRLYDSQGIALEAHQQNSLLDVTEGYPRCYYYRDNQGFYLSETLRPQLMTLEPELRKTEDLFYDDEMICDRFSYYLIVNQLFSVINRFGLDGLISEKELIKITHEKLEQLYDQMEGIGKTLISSILHRQAIPCKGNLLTRIEDLDELQAELELAVYTQIPNPLYFINKRHTHPSTPTFKNQAVTFKPETSCEVHCESA